MIPYVTHQPISLSMNPYHHSSNDEKRCNSSSCAPHDCECAMDSSNDIPHRACRRSRLRQLLVPALFALATVATIIFICCMRNLNTLGIFDGGVLEVGKRALNATQSNTGGSTFLNNKYYLIIVIVGLFLLLVFAIMLSAWCCRGIFQNPCCCPCYLCACCGGLACLDCIACGLC